MILKGVKKKLLVGGFGVISIQSTQQIPTSFEDMAMLVPWTEHHRMGANAPTEVLMFKSKHSVLDGNGKSESHL